MISIWCDFIERGFLHGEFKELVNKGLIQGVTSNPSIFNQALKDTSYLNDIQELKKQGKKPKEIYETLAIEDIKLASEILYPLYEKNPKNGLVSIEIDPFLCNDIDASIDEGVRLWHEIGAKNVMIKVPATKSGYAIMENLMLRKININATLVFTKQQAREVLKAFKKANTQAQGVISIFVSRFDRMIDSKISPYLRGKYAIANAIDIYRDFLTLDPSNNHRILFASTGVKEKNEIYNDEGYYVYPLAFDNCVNTLPLKTLKNIDYKSIDKPSDFNCCNILKEIINEDVNIEDIENSLLTDGLKSFEESFKDMLSTLN